MTNKGLYATYMDYEQNKTPFLGISFVFVDIFQ